MDNAKKILDILPKTVPVIYIMGFISINGYLSNYGFSDFNILNATYLKAGVLLTILIAFIFMAVYFAHSKDTMTDNLEESWPSVLLSIYNICLLSVILLTQLVDTNEMFKDHKWLTIVLFASFFLHGAFRLWADGKKAKNNLGILVVILPQIILIAPVIIIFIVNSQVALMLFIFVFIIAQTIGVSMGLYGDRTYNERLFTDILVLIMGSFFFGKMLYGNIPYKFGGGQPYEIICKLTDSDAKDLIAIKPDTLMVLYENDERLLLKDRKGEITFTIKSDLKSYTIRQKKPAGNSK